MKSSKTRIIKIVFFLEFRIERILSVEVHIVFCGSHFPFQNKKCLFVFLSQIEWCPADIEEEPAEGCYALIFRLLRNYHICGAHYWIWSIVMFARGLLFVGACVCVCTRWSTMGSKRRIVRCGETEAGILPRHLRLTTPNWRVLMTTEYSVYTGKLYSAQAAAIYLV